MAKLYQMFCRNCGEKIFMNKYKNKEKIRDKDPLKEKIVRFEDSHKGHQIKIIEYKMS